MNCSLTVPAPACAAAVVGVVLADAAAACSAGAGAFDRAHAGASASIAAPTPNNIRFAKPAAIVVILRLLLKARCWVNDYAAAPDEGRVAGAAPASRRYFDAGWLSRR